MKEITLKKTPLTIAIVGKGGVGKTIITTLIAKDISQNYKLKMLLVDADPAHPHLSHTVKLFLKKVYFWEKFKRWETYTIIHGFKKKR